MGAVAAAHLHGTFLHAIFGLTFYAMRGRKAYDAAGEDPFTDLPTRPAGESLRLKIDQTWEALQGALLLRLFTAIVAASLASTAQSSQRLAITLGVVVVVLIDFATTAPKILRLTAELRQYRLGYRGELVVAEHLKLLLADEYSVFHDIPFQGYNIDHVVVGPSGVFAVETKTWRKPKQNGKKGEHRLFFDGQQLRWPNYTESESLVQAQAGARSLSKFLSESTGSRVFVQPIVTAPGWWIDDNVEHEVWVLNPKRIRFHIESDRRNGLSSSQIQRLAYQLTQRCHLPPKDAPASDA